MRKHTGIPEQHFTQNWTWNPHKEASSCYSPHLPKSLVRIWESSSAVIQPQVSETGDPEDSPVCSLRSKTPHGVNVPGLKAVAPLCFPEQGTPACRSFLE